MCSDVQVMPLQWPAVGPLQVTPGTVQLGIAVEPLGGLSLELETTLECR